MTTSVTAPRVSRRPPRLAAQLATVPVVAAIVLAGVWVAGGVISNDFRLSVALTAAWLALSGLGCVFVAIRRRALRVPVLAAYLVTAAAIGTYLGLATLRDRVVDETVVTGTPAAAAPAANVELARARFRSGEHA